MSADLTSLIGRALAECERDEALMPRDIDHLAAVMTHWLAAHDREVAARAWDEGYRKGNLDGYFGTSNEWEKNPHGTEHRGGDDA